MIRKHPVPIPLPTPINQDYDAMNTSQASALDSSLSSPFLLFPDGEGEGLQPAVLPPAAAPVPVVDSESVPPPPFYTELYPGSPLVPPPPPPSSPPLAGHVPHSSYGSLAAYCFTVNYILGVGVLGMPNAFMKAGWVLALLCLLIVTIMATFTALWLAETGNRALRQQHALSSLSSPAVPILDTPRIEMNELVERFLGRTPRRLFELLLCIYMIGALWSYSAVFAQSLELAFEWDIDGLYYFYLAMFSLVVVPLTCLEMTELKPLAIALAIFRFVSLGMMMITALTQLFSYPSPDLLHANPSFVPESHPPYWSDMRAAVWAGLSIVFPVSIYSQIFHHSVPGIAHPLRDKQRLPLVFASVLMTTFALYAGLGLCVGAYYGSAINPNEPCTLLWIDYTGEDNTAKSDRSGLAVFISYLIVLFPPIDIISAFPLNAITLANNIMSASISPQKATLRRYVIPFRLAAASLPLLGAAIVSDLDQILHYTGCVGVMIAFLYPVALQYKSLQKEKEQQLQMEGQREGVPDDEHDHDTRHKDITTGRVKQLVNSQTALIVVFAFSVIGLVSVIVLSIIE